MRVALLNPPWRFDHSIYFGCREPHLPLELACATLHLEARGHETLMLDGHLLGLDAETLAAQTLAFAPDMIVVTTAPSYLFWRCAQPELAVPRDVIDRLRGSAITVVVGPHGSTTPATVLRKLDVDVVLRGECDEAVADLANAAGAPARVAGAAWREGGGVRVNGGPRVARFTDLAPLVWPEAWIARHHHHHHRFDAAPTGPGAEVEASRGCPYACTFCAKLDFRDTYRRRALPPLLAEIDALIGQGVEYLYFIDEIFLPQRPLLEALRERPIRFGVQTRIDLWKPDMLDLLGVAGCVSIEAGVREPHPGGPRRSRQEVPAGHRRIDRAAGARAADGSVRAGQPDQVGRRGCSADRRVAAWVAAPRRVGKRSRAAVPLSRLARLSPAVGRAGRRGMGTRACALSRPVRRLQRHPGDPPAAAADAGSGMRVLMAAPRIMLTTDAVGGVWRYCLELAAGLTACGAEVLLVSLGPAPSPTQRAEAGGLCALHVTDLALDWLAETPAQVAGAAEALAILAADWAADSVHLHTPALVPNADWPAPVVAVAHSCVGTWWRTIRGLAPMPPDLAWRAALVGAGLRAADAAVAPSRAFARSLAAFYGLARPIHAIHNGRRPLPTVAERCGFALTAGRLWDEAKNVRILDVAAARVGFEIRAAGPCVGPNGAAIACHSLRLLGILDDAALARAYAGAGVFVSVSRYEPFGLAVLEAAHSGCALVLSDIPTFRELWDGAALFVDPDDPDAVARALEPAMRNSGLGDAARARADEYSAEAMSATTFRLHRALHRAPAFGTA